MRFLLVFTATTVAVSAHARDYFSVVKELEYKNGQLSVSANDGCHSRKLEVEISLRQLVRGPSPVNPRFEIWHQHVDVKVYTDAQQDDCRALSTSSLERFDLAAAVQKKLREVAREDRAMVLLHLPTVQP